MICKPGMQGDLRLDSWRPEKENKKRLLKNEKDKKAIFFCLSISIFENVIFLKLLYIKTLSSHEKKYITFMVNDVYFCNIYYNIV